MKNTSALIVLLFPIFFSSCKKVEDKGAECIAGNSSAVPSIAFAGMADSVIHLNSGSTNAINTIFLSFSDADGDLADYAGDYGCNTNCSGPVFFPIKNSGDSCLLLDRCRHLFTIDNRDSVLSVYSFEPLGMNDRALTLVNNCRYRDTLRLRIACYSKKCFVPTGPACRDTVRLRVFARDQAMHFSNMIEIPPIVVVPE